MIKYSNIAAVKVKVLSNYHLHLEFEDGTSGKVDISSLVPFKGIFEPLKDTSFFARVTVNHDIGTICWENGADISPVYLKKNIQ